MVIGVMPDPEGHIAGKEVVRIPGMFRAGSFVFSIVTLAQQTIVLNVIDRLQHDVCADDMGQIEEQSGQTRQKIKGDQQPNLAEGV